MVLFGIFRGELMISVLATSKKTLVFQFSFRDSRPSDDRYVKHSVEFTCHELLDWLRSTSEGADRDSVTVRSESVGDLVDCILSPPISMKK